MGLPLVGITEAALQRRVPHLLAGVMRRAIVAMDTLGILDLLMACRRLWPRRSLIVLNYHRIFDGPTPLDDGVVSATAAEFNQQMEIVARTGTALTLNELERILDGRLPAPDNPVLITFDDGYSDNHERALPVLLRHGVPATFFISTGFVETGRLPWWDRVSYILKHTSEKTIELTYPRPLRLDLRATTLDPERRRLLGLIKDTQDLDLDRFFAGLEQATRVAVDEAALSRGLCLSWDQLRALRDAGMDIGSHTHTHRVLQTLRPGEAMQELALSRQILREQVGIPPRAVAYPVGRSLSRGSGLRQMVRDAGYSIGFTFAPGVIDLGPGQRQGQDLLNLPRLSVCNRDQRATARCKTALIHPGLLATTTASAMSMAL